MAIFGIYVKFLTLRYGMSEKVTPQPLPGGVAPEKWYLDVGRLLSFWDGNIFSSCVKLQVGTPPEPEKKGPSNPINILRGGSKQESYSCVFSKYV